MPPSKESVIPLDKSLLYTRVYGDSPVIVRREEAFAGKNIRLTFERTKEGELLVSWFRIIPFRFPGDSKATKIKVPTSLVYNANRQRFEAADADIEGDEAEVVDRDSVIRRAADSALATFINTVFLHLSAKVRSELTGVELETLDAEISQ
jgi:hypothetical protein